MIAERLREYLEAKKNESKAIDECTYTEDEPLTPSLVLL